MQRMTTLFAWGLAGLFAAGGVQAHQGGTEEQARQWPRINDRLELRYTLETEKDGERSPVAVTEGLESGDRFTLRVRPTEDAYLYLFVSDTEGSYTLVAPDLAEDGSLPAAVEGGADVQLPSGAVLRLDEEPGVERLYLLASTRPLTKVEELFGDERPQVDEARLIDLRDHYARNGTFTRQVRNAAVRVDYRLQGRGTAVVFETVVIRHYVPE